MGATESRRHVTPVVEGEALAAGDAVDVRDSATGDHLATVAIGSEETVTTALAAAEAARPSVRETTVAERAGWCERIAAAIRDREAELAEALVREAGVPIGNARAEVAAAADQFDRVADTLRSFTGRFRTWTTPDRGSDTALVTAAPLGVVRCRPAGRAPLAAATLQVAPALAAGNTVVLTPPPTAAVTVSLLADAVRSTVPTGVAGFVPAAADDAGDDGQADAVLSAGAAGVTRFERWLGGGATTVVFPDADLDAAAAAVTGGGPSAVGRRLAGATRVLVDESVQGALVERVADRMSDWGTGDPFDESTVVGTLPDGSAARRVERLVGDAVAAGADLVRGGEVDGRTCEPTVLADVPREAPLRSERVPGPVVPVTPFESESTALRLATQTGSLGVVSVFTDRHSLAMDVADAVDAGTVRIHGSGTDGSGDAVGVGFDSAGAAAAIRRLTRTRRVRTR